MDSQEVRRKVKSRISKLKILAIKNVSIRQSFSAEVSAKIPRNNTEILTNKKSMDEFYKECPNCEGTGKIEEDNSGEEGGRIDLVDCPKCGGEGIVEKELEEVTQ